MNESEQAEPQSQPPPHSGWEDQERGKRRTDESDARDDAERDPSVRLVVALPLARALVRVGALVLVPPAIPDRTSLAPSQTI